MNYGFGRNEIPHRNILNPNQTNNTQHTSYNMTWEILLCDVLHCISPHLSLKSVFVSVFMKSVAPRISVTRTHDAFSKARPPPSYWNDSRLRLDYRSRGIASGAGTLGPVHSRCVPSTVHICVLFHVLLFAVSMPPSWPTFPKNSNSNNI